MSDKLCEDLEIFKGWFRLVQNTINEYSIQTEDIYNFDETGFQQGQISSCRVITSSDKQGKLKLIKPKNTEWVSLLQAIYADGTAMPPSLILKGKLLNENWFH